MTLVSIAALITVFLIAGFFINLPIYLIWLSFQKPSNEVFLYMVRGKFTYLNVLDLVSRIERETNQSLSFERKKIELFFNNCQKRNISFKRYRPAIYRLLKKKAFGKSKIKSTLSRMPFYTKLVAFWDILIPLSLINLVVLAMAEDTEYLYAIFFGSLLGFIPAAFVWFICHMALNSLVKFITEMRIQKASSIPYRIAMAQFWAFFAGYFWRDIYWIDLRSYSPMGVYFGGYSTGWDSGSDFGGFDGGDFGGGGAGGDW